MSKQKQKVKLMLMVRTPMAVAVSASILVACGGGGAGGVGQGSGGGSTPGASTAASIQVMADYPSLESAGPRVATITAIAKDAANNILPRQAVSFSTTDANSAITPGASPSVTDSGGSATAKLQAAGSYNRDIPVRVRIGDLEQTINLAVVGTSVKPDGLVRTLSSGASDAFTVQVLDSAAKGVDGAVVTLALDKSDANMTGNATFSAMTATTANGGLANFTMTASGAGPVRVVMSSMGAAAAVGVDIVAPSMAPTLTWTRLGPSSQDANGVERVPIGTSQQFSIAYQTGGVPSPNKVLSLALTRGAFSNNSNTMTVTTDGSGVAVVSVQSPSAGSGTLTAVDTSASSVSGATSLRYFSGPENATKISISPDISSVGTNLSGSSSNKAVLTAVVRDANDNPIEGATVAFTAIQDKSGGAIQTATALSDATGKAVSAFIPGGSPTGFNEVILQASVAGTTPIQARADLTVASVPLYIELGAGAKLLQHGDTQYEMPWTAIVTDSSRNPIPNANVSVSLTAIKYYKGVWASSLAGWSTAAYIGSVASGPPVACLSEDINNNNLLDAGEDKNASDKLEPGSPAAVLISGPTDSSGSAALSVVYPRSSALWADVTLRATIDSTGTQSSVSRTFRLPVLATDVGDPTVSPPNVSRVVPAAGTGLSASTITIPTIPGNGQNLPVVSLTTQPGLRYGPGIRVRLATRVSPSNTISGYVSSYDSATGAMVLSADSATGQIGSTFNDWNVGPGASPLFSGPYGYESARDADGFCIAPDVNHD